MSFRYPVTLDLEGRRCVVVGGGEVAEPKVRGLVAAGAQVVVVAPSLTPGLLGLAEDGVIAHVVRDYAAGDLEGAFLAIAATDDEAVRAMVREEATRRGVLVNVVDDPTRCDFSAPSVLARGDLTIAVSTAGKAPALARRVRTSLEGQFGPEWGVLVELLASVRAEVGGRGTLAFATWAERWSSALDADLPALVREGRVDEARALVRQALAGEEPPGPEEFCASGTTDTVAVDTQNPPAVATGSVAIVGAGPGDPSLLTLRGRALLDAADVVVYDRLVHPSLREGAGSARAIDAGKEPGGHSVDQAQINDLLIALAREGRRVVRLKGGDPFVFGRGAEEASALAEAGIPYEIVPGVTSAVAALEAAGIPVTDRRAASSVAIVTGHCAAGRVDWASLATAADTLVVLMGLGHLREIVAQVVAAGRPATTPAAVVQDGTLPSQRVVVASLGDLADAVARENLRSPSVIVIGNVVNLRETFFPMKPSGHG